MGLAAIDKLEQAVREFLAREDRRVDPKRLRVVMDSLDGEFSVETRAAQLSGDNFANGNPTVVTWLSRLCGMSATSTADRLCVGTQLESLPRIAEALRTGEISYQSTSQLCHLRDQLGEKRDLFDEDEMLDLARKHSVASLRYLCRYARHLRRVRLSAPRSIRWPSGWGLTTIGATSSGWPTPSASWCTTQWTRAGCPGATASSHM